MGCDGRKPPRNPLAQLLAEPGGLSPDEAIAAATANALAMAGEGAAELCERIAEIERILLEAAGMLGPQALAEVHARADQIVSLAGTFGHEMLDIRARRLCDAIAQVPPQTATDAGFIAAHLRAIRLLSPERPAV